MPNAPQGQQRPADVIGAAVKVMQIATGEIWPRPFGVRRSEGACRELDK